MSAVTGRVPEQRRLFRIGGSDEYGLHQVLLGLFIVFAPAGFLLCAVLAGAQVTPWLLLALPALVALVPRADTMLPLLLWAALGAIWVIQVPGPFTWWAAPAGVFALVSHVACSLLAGAPTQIAWPATTIRRHGRRIAVVGAATVVVAALAQLAVSVAVGGNAIVVAAAMLAVAAWLWLGRLRDDGVDTAVDPTG